MAKPIRDLVRDDHSIVLEGLATVLTTGLFGGESTVKTHIINIFNKLEAKGRAEAVAEAVRRGIIKL